MPGIEVFDAWLDEDDRGFRIEEFGSILLSSVAWLPDRLRILLDVVMWEDEPLRKIATWQIDCIGVSDHEFRPNVGFSWPRVVDNHPRLAANLSGQGVTVSFDVPVRDPQAHSVLFLSFTGRCWATFHSKPFFGQRCFAGSEESSPEAPLFTLAST